MHVALLVATVVGCGTGSRTDEGGFAADVVATRVTGDASAYTFYVSIRSDETGCDRYADWWELLTPEGALVYRRILDHSHPDEQPFERSGGPVDVGPDDPLVVRAHLHPQGYGGTALAGTASGAFTLTTLEDGFAADLETSPPLPASCLF